MSARRSPEWSSGHGQRWSPGIVSVLSGYHAWTWAHDGHSGRRGSCCHTYGTRSPVTLDSRTVGAMKAKPRPRPSLSPALTSTPGTKLLRERTFRDRTKACTPADGVVARP